MSVISSSISESLEIFAFTLISPLALSTSQEPLIAVVVTGALLFASIDFLYPDQAVAKTRYVLVSSLVISSLYALGGLSLFGATCSSRLRKGLGAIFIVLALCFLGRIHPSFAHGMNIFTPGLIQSLTFVAILIAIVCGIGFMLLMHEAAVKALRLAATTDALRTRKPATVQRGFEHRVFPAQAIQGAFLPDHPRRGLLQAFQRPLRTCPRGRVSEGYRPGDQGFRPPAP